jgi:lon-related putative ATP-dependent protease
VVLVDEPIVYYLLHAADPEFGELFKIVADFDDRMPRTRESTLAYARFIATQARAQGLRPLERGAVARLIEHAARRAGDAERLTTLVHAVKDVIVEADHRAALRDAPHVADADVSAAIAAAERRSDRLRDRLLEETERGTILIDTDGERVGQVNGLAVLQLGDFAFGRPSRITARVRVGSGQVVDIEREVALGGALHSKGVLILSSYLASRYAEEEPLSLAASLVFEQSYGGIDGDSASCAELYALLSALAGVPLRQSFAVTGSVNQHGEVQAIGGVNEKIEGFFDLCRRRGLSGRQGVLIPSTNVRHLMLREDVVAACERGEFAVHAVASIDQGIEILTGLPAGVAQPGGAYPEGSVNRRVQDRLRLFAERRRDFARPTAADEAKT